MHLQVGLCQISRSQVLFFFLFGNQTGGPKAQLGELIRVYGRYRISSQIELTLVKLENNLSGIEF